MPEVAEKVKPKLIHDIPDELIPRMKAHLVPIILKKGHIVEAIDVSGIDPVKVAYTWDEEAAREDIGCLIPVFATQIMSFHQWGYYGLFKPSLYEVYCAIYLAFGDKWDAFKYFWLDSRNMGTEAIIGDYQLCRCLLWQEDQLREL